MVGIWLFGCDGCVFLGIFWFGSDLFFFSDYWVWKVLGNDVNWVDIIVVFWNGKIDKIGIIIGVN